MTLDPAALQRALDTCAREQIQFSGAIQPSGYLLVCGPGDWRVRHASRNCEALFDLPIGELLDQPIGDLLDEALTEAVKAAAVAGQAGLPPVHAGAGNLGPRAEIFELGVHLADGLVHIEIEPQGPRARAGASELSQRMVAHLVNIEDEDRFHRRVADEVRELTGYDRVMVYRFLHDDSGEVIAESRAADLEPYHGLRYPASDIPPQARTLYLRNRIRVIPDVDYTPVPIEPATLPDGRPLDLSQHRLRSVAPVHLAYLRNMGVAASMSISLIVEGRLWGLIACHHRTPRAVPPAVRGAADLFGLFVSMRVAARELQQTTAYQDRARTARDRLEARLVENAASIDTLMQALDLVCEAVPADGAALVLGARRQLHGRVPSTEGLDDALAWLARQPAPDVAASSSAAQWRRDGGRAGDGIAGVLAVPVRPQHGEWLLLFRREQIEDVRWAGRPDEPFQIDAAGLHIGPRASFAAWRETWTGHSRPWTPVDADLAERLRLLLLHRYLPHVDDAALVQALAGRRAQLESSELRQRLGQLVDLTTGLESLDQGQAERLLAEVDQLQARLRAAVSGARPSPRPH